MKHPFLKVLVVLFSISAVSAYVWHASQKRSTMPAPVVTTAVETEEEDTSPAPVITDEEFRVKKEAMLSSSKSGVIMMDEDIRKVLEEQKQSDLTLIPSSKSLAPTIPPSDLKDLIDREKEKTPSIEEITPNNPAPQDLSRSSKSASTVVSPADLKKVIDKAKQQPDKSNKLAQP